MPTKSMSTVVTYMQFVGSEQKLGLTDHPGYDHRLKMRAPSVRPATTCSCQNVGFIFPSFKQKSHHILFPETLFWALFWKGQNKTRSGSIYKKGGELGSAAKSATSKNPPTAKISANAP